VNNFKYKSRAAHRRRRNIHSSLFQLMTPAESRQARAIAVKAALAVLG
jgi:hypothetical protein